MVSRGGKLMKGLARSMKDARSVEWAEAVKSGLRFSVSPKRFLPFLLSDLAASLILLILIGSMSLEELMLGASLEASLPPEVMHLVLMFSLAYSAWVILDLWISGSVICQSSRPDEFKESWWVALRRLPSMVVALIVVSVISFVASLIPYVELLMAVIVSLLFLFVNQIIILDGRGFYGALLGSVKTFRRKGISVFLTWLLSMIFVMIIVGIFTLPLLVSFATIVGPQETVEQILSQLISGSADPMLYASLVLLLAGVSISKVFGLRFMTDIYLQLKKKRWIFF
jgi:hypothetical protein